MTGIKKLLLFIMITASLGALTTATAFADSDTITQKAAYAGVVQCYEIGGDNGGLLNVINLSEFDGSAKSMFGKTQLNVRSIGESSNKDTCLKTMSEGSTAYKLNKNSTGNDNEKIERLEKIFYHKSTDDGENTQDDGKNCVTFDYRKKSEAGSAATQVTSATVYGNYDESHFSPKICVAETGDGSYVATTEDVAGQNDSSDGLYQHDTITFDTKSDKIIVKFRSSTGEKKSEVSLSGENAAQILATVGNRIADLMGSTLENGTYFYYPTGGGYTYEKGYYHAFCQRYTYYKDNTGIKCESVSNDSGATNADAFNKLFDSKGSSGEYLKPIVTDIKAKDGVVNLFSDGNYPTYSSITFEPEEIYQLYSYYLQNIYGVNSISCSENPLSGVGDYKARLWWDEGNKYSEYCYFNVNDNKKDIKVNGVKGNGIFGAEIGLEDMLLALDKLTITAKPNSYIPQSTDSNPTEDSEYETDPCIENAASLGWIVCPLMNKIAEALDGLYDQIIEPFLIVNPSLLSPEGGTWEAWSIMVNIANILTGIFLLVVIFSQLTGVGIDNYNIKKSLPKIITAALLINLSFVICQLAVDLSNILGNSLNKLLTDIGTGIPIKLPDGVSAETSDQASWFKGLLTLGAGGIVGIGTISIVQEVFFGGGLVSGLILPALLLFVTAIVSIIFFFIILGVRKAGVVIFVVLSPLAFVCYMLPNTKKYFDKWLDGFKALLLVYPICGLLLGGSYLASRILLQTSTDYIMYFAGSMMLIVPYFFIPSLLKGSLRAMGDLGAKLSSFGKTLGSKSSNRLGNTVKNSRGYQERVKQNQENAALRRANRIKKRLGSKNYDELSRRQQRSLYNAQSALIADKDIEKRAKNMSTTGYDAALEAIKKKADAEDVANHMMLINSATKNGADETELMNMFNKYMESGDTSGAVAAARIAGRRKDTASRFMNDTIMNAEKSKKYDSTALAKVAKEISEGENSKNYRAATPLGFEYASQLNSGTAKNAAGSAATGYADWLSNQDNITNAMNHHVTDSGELVGVQGGNLRELADLMEAGHISDTEKNRIQSLARDTIANRDKGPWDTTKADEIYRLAYGENYLQQMAADGVPSKNSVPSQPSNPSPALRGSSTFTMQGVSGQETFTQTADGRVFDSQGRAIEDPGLVIRHHQDQRKQEMYQNMTEAQLRSRAENAKASEAVRQGANDELRRRGFN